jgi:hemoglobin
MNQILRGMGAALLASALLAGCASQEEEKARDFHTSGSREADQRAEQRINKDQQLKGEGPDAKGSEKRALYERLGGDKGLRAIVADFVDRVIADPRVNWERQGIKRGGVLGIGGKSAEWSPSAERVAALKEHLVQFIAVATGGPSKYEGRQMKEAHQGMKITNAEFDGSIGDLKATLDALKVPTDEQKELIAVLESTRPLIVEER